MVFFMVSIVSRKVISSDAMNGKLLLTWYPLVYGLGEKQSVPLRHQLELCGEILGRPEYISKLRRCGIRVLSVAPALIPQVKQAIREAKWLA
jgi:hypothetical protein